MAVHWVLGPMHVVVVVLALFPRADHLTRLVCRMIWPVLLYHLTCLTWLFLLVKDVLKPFPTPWRDRQGIRLLLHVLAPELS